MIFHNTESFDYEMEIFLILEIILIKKEFSKNFKFKYNIKL